MRGQSAVIQAMGNYELATSQASILFEQSRALDRENDLKQTEALLAQQEMWREGREAEREYRDAQLEAGPGEVDQSPGDRAPPGVPAVADRPEHGHGRNQLAGGPAIGQVSSGRGQRMEELFRQHVSYGDPQPGVVAEITRGTKAMAKALQKDIRTLSREDYVAAQKFLLGTEA